MADGSTKPIEDIELGEEVVATDPDTGVTKREKVALLHLNQDNDLTDVTVQDAKSGKTSVLKTTQHHPFWDATDQQWVDAAQLKVGHRLLVHDEKRLEGDGTGAGMGGGGPGREVTVVKVHNFDGNKTMRDLTVANTHTYYVHAGDTPILVHNCNKEDAHEAYETAFELNELRASATNDKFGPDWGTTSVIGIYNTVSGRAYIRTGINGVGDAPDSWPQWAKDAFVKTDYDSHAEEGVLDGMGPEEYVLFGAASRGLCWNKCHPRLAGDPAIKIGGPAFKSNPERNSPWRIFWRE